MCIDLERSLAVSESGDEIVGVFIHKKQTNSLIKVSFKTDRSLNYSHTHTRIIFAVAICERRNWALSGDGGGKLVLYNYSSGNVLRVMEDFPDKISFLSLSKNGLFVGSFKCFYSVDLIQNKKEKFLFYSYDCLTVYSIKQGYTLNRISQKKELLPVLLFGGEGSPNVHPKKLSKRDFN